ncbi:MAG: GntR family transcriptional regulator [Burkholderiales bacterium]|uniref:GntR family transcriptional regulator n=1 Tax=Ottowia sp. TaxID=1898956 RepID=UPI001ACD63D4|nr:GntR family transcriptional regulator [Ottowia sp.]MBN9405348.1 GntR family transcriptional regulator [Burkholderiales bacterium]HMN56191.1 GntR family transcriptional regulator [Ottowia sp.]
MDPALPTPDDGESKTDQAYQLLRREILAARLPADMALRPTALNKAYGLGWTPVREALARLEAERLVVYQRNRGFAVAPVSRAELQDLRRARQAIELPLLREAMEHGDDAWEAALVAAHHRLLRCTLPVGDPSEAVLAHWEQMHEAFHKALLQAAVSTWLLRFQAQIAEQLQRYHRVLAIVPTLQGGGRPDPQARAALRRAMAPEPHTELMHAVLARDVERALALMAEHIGVTQDVFESSSLGQPTAPLAKPAARAGAPAVRRKAPAG